MYENHIWPCFSFPAMQYLQPYLFPNLTKTNLRHIREHAEGRFFLRGGGGGGAVGGGGSFIITRYMDICYIVFLV